MYLANSLRCRASQKGSHSGVVAYEQNVGVKLLRSQQCSRHDLGGRVVASHRIDGDTRSTHGRPSLGAMAGILASGQLFSRAAFRLARRSGLMVLSAGYGEAVRNLRQGSKGGQQRQSRDE